MYQVSSTYKMQDVESWFDNVLSRPFGNIIAAAAIKFRLTPDIIAFLRMLLGIFAGHLFVYNNFALDVTALFILVFCDALKSTSLQLAELTQQHSKIYENLEMLALNFTFISIYIHLCMRMVNGGITDAVFLLAMVCGMSHVFQKTVSNFYKNVYLMIVCEKKESKEV